MIYRSQEQAACPCVLTACPGPAASPRSIVPRALFAWVLLRGGGCWGQGWKRCREQAEIISWFPASVTGLSAGGDPLLLFGLKERRE